jgi:DUF177 domain-containing protein
MDPVVIDPRQFANERATASGSVAASTLGRLAEVLFDAGAGQQRGGMIHYCVTGFVTPKDQPALRLEVDGEISLCCQRCLGPLAYPLAVQRELVLVAGADEFEQAADEPDSVDMVPLVARIDLRELVEEEVLLALPLAPRHPAGACRSSAAEQAPSPPGASPFAALARLKKH